MTKKEQLYFLLKEFCNNNYDVKTFCIEYEKVLYSEHSVAGLNEFEISKFYELGKIVVRFSPFNEDIEKYPGVYYSEECIRDAIIRTYVTLTMIQ